MSNRPRFTLGTRLSIGFAVALIGFGLALRGSRATMAPPPVPGLSSTIFINEIHYDNTGTDSGEFVELAGPAGTSLSGYSIVRYNGNGGATYTSPAATTSLPASIPSQQGGYGTVTVSYATDGLQNGAPDGVALVGPSGVIQFLCYEGTFAATNGPASGQTCTSIGVAENGSEAVGLSLQLTGSGTTYGDFSWTGPVTASRNAVNAGQTFGTVVTDTAPTVSSTSPVNGASGVAASSNIGITFSESVNATAAAFTIECPTGTPMAFAQSASPATTFTLDPTTDLPASTVCTVTVDASQITDADVNDPPDLMAANFVFSFTTAAPPPPVAENVIINEVDSDTPSTDMAEFIELYDGGDGNTALDGLVVVFYNGNGDVSYRAIDLDGRSTNASGYFIIGNSAVPGVDLTFPNDTLQNGPDAVALFAGDAASFPTGSPVTTTNLKDAVVYGTDDADDTGLLILLNAGQPQVDEDTEGDKDFNSNQRCPNGSGGARNTSTYSQAAPTVGDVNVCTPPPPSPTPTPAGEQGPAVLFTSPGTNGTNAPRDASIRVGFTEPVNVTMAWYNIDCLTTGLHNSATIAGGPSTFVITPNVNFLAGEQCTVTIFKDFVEDQDLDDGAPNTNTMAADYSWSFTVATGTAPPYLPEVHLTMGNPSGAEVDIDQPNNYLMEKPEYALSYNRSRGGPNWVSWHLSDEWVGTLSRVDTFRPDPQVPPDWYRVQSTDLSGSGFDRGHMVPNADRDKETSRPINQATFLMSNILPQAPDNNRGPWAKLEEYLRTLLPANEIYIIAGGEGTGGTGSSNVVTTTLANGNIIVPAKTWKVALVIPKALGDDVARTRCESRMIAVIMPNTQGIFSSPWENYLTTGDAVEQLTGYDLFSNLPDAVEHCVEAGTNGTNPPGTAGQSVTTNEDTPVAIALTATSPNNVPITYTIVDAPDHGQLTGTNGNRTYTPDPNYFGSDSFTFKVNDGTNDSNTSTVNITVHSVNDAPVATGESYITDSNTQLNVPAPGVLSNDTDVEGPLSAVLVSDVSNGTLTLNGDGSFSYMPDPNFEGADSFTYHAYDGEDYSNTVTVDITVNDKVPPVLTSSVAITSISSNNSNLVNVGLAATATDNSGDPVTIVVTVFGDEDDQTPTINNTVHSPDAKDIAPNTLRLRGERVEDNDGRVYLIIVTATDSSGNVSRNYHTVVVPKGNGAAKIAEVNAQAAAALSTAQSNNDGTPPPGYFVIGDGPVIGPKQ